MSANLKKLRPYDEPPTSKDPLVPAWPDSAATMWFVAAAVWLVIATGIGAIWILQAMFPQAILHWHAALPFNLNIWIVLDATRMLPGFENALVYGR